MTIDFTNPETVRLGFSEWGLNLLKVNMRRPHQPIYSMGSITGYMYLPAEYELLFDCQNMSWYGTYFSTKICAVLRGRIPHMFYLGINDERYV